MKSKIKFSPAESELLAMGVSHNTTISAADALMVLQFSVGKIPSLS